MLMLLLMGDFELGMDGFSDSGEGKCFIEVDVEVD